MGFFERVVRSGPLDPAAAPLEPDSWLIEELPEGWRLRYRPPLSGFSRHLPWLRWCWMRVPAAEPWAMCVWVVAITTGYLFVVGLLDHWQLTLPRAGAWGVAVGALSAFLGTIWHVVGWPLLAEADANLPREVVVRDGRVHVWQGVFPAHCLRSLQLGTVRKRAYKDRRVSLLFRGEKVRDVWLVDDVSERTGAEILAAVLDRIEGGAAVAAQGPHEIASISA